MPCTYVWGAAGFAPACMHRTLDSLRISQTVVCTGVDTGVPCCLGHVADLQDVRTDTQLCTFLLCKASQRIMVALDGLKMPAWTSNPQQQVCSGTCQVQLQPG